MRLRALLVACLILGGSQAVAAESPDTGNRSPAAADQTSPDTAKAARLNGLFEVLRTTTDPQQGRAIETAIVSEWLKSGDPDTDEVMAQAMIAMQSGDFKVALSYLDTLVAARPDYVEAWNKRATIYFFINEYDKSLADIAKTLALEPRHFGALAGLGMILLRQGDKQGALEAFEQAVAVDPALDNIKSVVDQLKDEISKGI